jgi:hypothetical protein
VDRNARTLYMTDVPPCPSGFQAVSLPPVKWPDPAGAATREGIDARHHQFLA